RLDANGRLPDTNLSSNVALLNSSAAFAGSITATTFNGNAAGLSNLNSANLTGPIIAQPTFGRGHTNDGGSARGVAVLGRYAYVADELNGLLIYDISNPAMPMRVSQTNDGGNGWSVTVTETFSVFPFGLVRHAYLANMSDGLRI